jgi:hypothetical protein
MSQESRVWQQVRGDEFLAELVVTGRDFPLAQRSGPANGKVCRGAATVRDELRWLDHLD